MTDRTLRDFYRDGADGFFREKVGEYADEMGVELTDYKQKVEWLEENSPMLIFTEDDL